MNSEMFDAVIVGAGPAGLSAAKLLLDQNLKVLLVDENEHLGGQIFRESHHALHRNKKYRNPVYPWGDKLIETVAKHQYLTFLAKHSVVGILEEQPAKFTVFIVDQNGISARYEVKTILIATGAYDFPLPVEGWTNPGVMGTAGVQAFLKSQSLLLGKNIVLYGSHPLLIITASQLVKAGANIAGFYFHKPKITLKQIVPALWQLIKQIRPATEMFSSILTLLKHNALPKFNQKILSISNQDNGLVVDVVPLTKQEDEIKNSTNPNLVKADLVVLGFGLCPSTDLARQLGCELELDMNLGGWCVKHDKQFMTSKNGIFVAGEPTGVGGANLSRAEGEVAGFGMLNYLGVTQPADDRLKKLQSDACVQLGKMRKFAKIVQEVFPNISESAIATLNRDTIICRCEGLTKEKLIEELLAKPFIKDVNALKLESRAGMGRCQGRFCELSLVSLLAQSHNQPLKASRYLKSHFPVRPVTIGSLAKLEKLK